MIKIKNIATIFSQHKIVYSVLGVLFVCGAFLRLWQFSPLMHFELDQARDMFVVYDMVEGGAHDIPLIGPQARGRELYLGPLFYYFSYVSARLFGVSPETVALPDVLFSLCAIPLFYLFTRRFFDRPLSCGMTGIVAVSLFLVIYGRFAWNPNSMFFWSLVTFYSILRAWDGTQLKRGWFASAVVGLAVVTQLHFVAFIAAPATFIAYMLCTRMRVPLGTALLALCVGLLLYSPLIYYDATHNGKNTKAFFASVLMSENDSAHAQTARDKKHHITERIFRAAQETSTFYWHIISADNHGRYHIRTKKSADGHIIFVCDEKCKNALVSHIVAMSVFGIAFVLFVRRLYGGWKKCAAQHMCTRADIAKRNAYTLVGLWCVFAGVFYVLVAYQISPRFYLFVAAPFMILYGMCIETLMRYKRIGMIAGYAVIAVLIAGQLWMHVQHFGILRASEHTTVAFRDLSLNRHDFVTLGQLRAIAHYIHASDMPPFVIVGDNRYARAMYYLVGIEHNDNRALCYSKRGGFDAKNVRGIPYVLVTRTQKQQHITPDMRATHDVTAHRTFGTMTLYIMTPHTPLPSPPPQQPEQCFVR